MRYEELLKRNDKGLYKYQVNIQPKNQKIQDFVIKVYFKESLPLKEISVWQERVEAGGKSQRHEITSKTYGKHQLTNNAQVAFYPNDADNSGKDWKFQIQYDVERLVSI